MSQAGSKGRMFERCKKAKELAWRRSIVEAAQDQYRSRQLDAVVLSVPPQPSDRDRSLHELTHTHTISALVQVLCDEQGKRKPPLSCL